jgi:FkbM family methyltransferase
MEPTKGASVRQSFSFLLILLGIWGFYQHREHAKCSEIETGGVVALARNRRRDIFIDLGANCGNSYLLLKSKNGLPPSQDTHWDVYLWEANPTLVKLYLNDLVDGTSRKAEVGTDRVHVIGAAAATSDTEMKFYLTKDQETATSKEDFRNSQCDIHSNSNPSGGSSLLQSSSVVGRPINVPAYDFGRWLSALNVRGHDRLVIKIDIEGAEVDLLEHLLTRYPQDFCNVESLMIEWHAFLFDDAQLRQKHEHFKATFPDKFQRACGKPPNLARWH